MWNLYVRIFANYSATLIIQDVYYDFWILNQGISLVTDTLSLGDRTIDNMDRHAIQPRPRQQLLDHSSGQKSKQEPTFDFSQNTNVTALIGKTAYLTCRVRHLGDKTVRTFCTISPITRLWNYKIWNKDTI